MGKWSNRKCPEPGCEWCRNGRQVQAAKAPTVEEQLREYDPCGDAAEARLAAYEAAHSDELDIPAVLRTDDD